MNNTIKLENKGHTMIIAHRGLCGLETAATMALRQMCIRPRTESL